MVRGKRGYADFRTPSVSSYGSAARRMFGRLARLSPSEVAGLAALAGSVSSSISRRNPLNSLSSLPSVPSSSRGSGKSRSTSSSYAQSGLSNRASTLVTMGKRGKKKSKKKLPPALNKRQKKSVRRLVKVSDKDMLHSKETNVMHQVSNAVNKVEWSELILQTTSDFNARCNFTSIGNNDANTVSRIEEISMESTVTSYLGKKFYFEDSHRFKFKNNTNSSAEMVIYVVKCTDYTSYTPLNDLTEMRKAAFGSTIVLAKEDDFNQYWTVPRIGTAQRKWRIHKRFSIDLGGGEEAILPIRLPQVGYDPAVVVEMGSSAYMKGQYAIICRIMGKPSHDVASLSTLGMSNTLVDAIEYRKEKTSVQTSNVIKAVRQQGNSGVGLAAAVCADPFAVGIGPFDAT